MQGVAFHLTDEWEGSSMTATISVVVPTFNSAPVIEQCLASLKNQSQPPVNIIVCDGGSTDETVAIASALGATVVHAEANRSGQRNAGAMRAVGDYIVFIDSDMRLTENLLADCIASFRISDAALAIPEVDIGDSYWARVRGFERSFYKGVWWLQAARCYRKSQFIEIGGFDVGLVGPEDWDLDERIRQFGDVREISATIEHDEGRTDLGGLMRKKTHYSSSFANFQARHPRRAALCFSGRRRALLFARRPGRILAHPILAAGLVTMGTAEISVARGWSNHWGSDSKERPLDSVGNPLLNGDTQ
jgi:glycosyltransferase involved in cell wall biosynthesis